MAGNDRRGIVIQANSAGEVETEDIGERLGALLRAGDVVLLDGPLGAGKTRLARGITRGIGADVSLVASPTYVLAHVYPAVRALGTPVVHVDAYRISGAEDLATLGWDRLADGSTAVLIEWGERVADGLGAEPSLARVRIDPDGASQTGRTITLILPKAWAFRGEWGALRDLDERARGRPSGACPVCGRASGTEAGTGGVFCSDRCRMADLGRWLTEAYRVGRPIEPDEVGET